MSIVSIPSLGLITLNQYTIINHLSCKKNITIELSFF